MNKRKKRKIDATQDEEEEEEENKDRHFLRTLISFALAILIFTDTCSMEE